MALKMPTLFVVIGIPRKDLHVAVHYQLIEAECFISLANENGIIIFLVSLST